MNDPTLAPHFEWDAQRLSKFNGKEYVRFIHEPYTADRFWEIQVCKCLHCQLIKFILKYHSQLFLQMANFLQLLFTLIKQNYHHLKQLWAIW